MHIVPVSRQFELGVAADDPHWLQSAEWGQAQQVLLQLPLHDLPAVLQCCFEWSQQAQNWGDVPENGTAWSNIDMDCWILVGCTGCTYRVSLLTVSKPIGDTQTSRLNIDTPPPVVTVQYPSSCCIAVG